MNEEKNTENEYGEIDLKNLLYSALGVIKRFWWLFVIIAITVSSGVFLLWKKTYVPVYKSYCSFTVKVVNDSTTGEINTLYGFYYDKDLATQLDKTFTYILTGDILNDEIRYKLGESFEKGNVSARCIEGSNLFVLTAFGDTPKASAELLEAVLEVYDDAARYVVGELLVELVEKPVTVDTPTNTPSLVIAVFIGALISVLVCCVLIFIEYFTNRTVKSPEDLDERINIGCLGIVPEVEDRHKSKFGGGLEEHRYVESEFRESVFGICRKLEQIMEDRGMKILLVSSTMPGEGKTTVSQGIAYTLARWGKKVYILDGDLRKPSLYKRFGINGKVLDLQGAIEGKIDIEDIVEKVGENIWFAGNTRSVLEPTVLLDGLMEGFIKKLSEKADYLIIDAPPCELMSDVMILQRYSDALLYVVKQDYAHLRNVVSVIEDLCVMEQKAIGFVLNGTEKTSRGYGKYGYGAYSYGKYGNGYYGRYGSGYNNYYGEDNK